MAARKLQTEIDRTLKKVAEGVELFESIYDKMQASTNQTQKEKLETDLKTQIKKLQRLRDQIKTWVASNDIKDKTALLDNRRLIETQMEKFKACEKEMKTKAFSKEGLTQHAKLDPKAQEKLEVTQWIQIQVEELLLQVEQAEAEIETLQGGGKKKNRAGGAAAERLEALEHLNERRKWHISRLELILRLMDNGSMPTERVLGLKEDVQYFVESNTDEDFDEDEGIYDELNLDEEEEKFGLANDEDSDESEDASDGTPVLKKATATLQLRSTLTPSITGEASSPAARKNTFDSTATVKPPNANFAAQPMASILKAGLPPQQRPAPLPVRYAAAAAAAVAPSLPTQQSTAQSPQTPTTATIPSTSTQPSAPTAPSISSTTATSSLTPDQVSAVTSSPSLTHPSVASPMLSSAASVSVQHADSYSDSPALSDAPPSSISGPAATSSPQRIQRKGHFNIFTDSRASFGICSNYRRGSHSPRSTPAVNAQSSGSSPLPPTQLPQYPPGVKAPGAGLAADHDHSVPPGVAPQQLNLGAQRPGSTVPSQMPQQAPQTRPNAFPGSLSDLVVSFETVKQKAPHRMSNLDQVHKLLQGSYSSMPQPQDTEKPKYYVPRNPIQTPAYYPQTPNPILNTAGIFSQLDVETLFYVFYYLPGTYQQYLAAKELKRQSWRFHVKYLTWFQRHSEPQAITEEYEQGVYVYFDWEGSWCQRKKSDFRFEYRYLSED
ncbi:Not1 N-terminal domain, CCR4-Not complex component-domain-containing protein [Fomitopsis serialis]|uniref:Not1 N-terminal domain, CCR4-Not complex component-domain-containing protein n=1 Tax=Fomitopsis serialis TaxID=139415 RepID=UPI0020087ECE|nr:Not1 N-terminal domain, CCR4-Not complex component-domain-containing protein [Neoantrodia serialis]KAH9918113.1 Not1 N-terminal domain, CCR4-Not complex component-domain-containing protein [Neoantrodia serialis]